MPPSGRHLETWCAWTIVAVACSSANDSGSYRRSDSLGVSLITYETGFEASGAPGFTVDSTPLFTIGEPEVQLYRVSVARFQSDGGVVIANTGSNELLLFDARGGFRARAGGDGQGPGEFRRLSQLAIGPADSLIAYDERSRRISVFDPLGTLPRVFSLPAADTLGRVTDVGTLETGDIIVALHRRAPGTGLVRDSLIVAVFSRTGKLSYQVGTFPHFYTHWGPHALPGEPGPVTVPVPVPLSGVTEVAANRSAVYVGLAEQFTLIRVGADGRWRITRQQQRPDPITQAHRDQLFARLAAHGRSGPEEDLLRGVTGPTTLPAFGDEPLTQSYDDAILITDAGEVWVKPFELDEAVRRAWLRFDADGLYRGTVSVPARFRPTAVRNDVVLGVFRDGQDVESVRAFRIVDGPARRTRQR